MQVGVDPGTGKLKTEARHYIVKAGAHERFPGVVARYYLDQMSKQVAQDEDKFKLFADYGTREKIYERLIVDTEDLIASPLLEFPAATPQVVDAPAAGEEVAFAGVKQEAPRLGRPPKTS